MINIKELKENIENKINTTEKTIVVPHNRTDCDAIASSLGLSLIARKLKKQSYIVMNDQPYDIDSSVTKIIDECRKDFNILNLNKYSSINNENDCFVLTDVNKSYLVSVKEYLTNPDNIFIIDHHDADQNTILSNYKYIDTSYSSASEIVTNLLCASKIKIPSTIADYLYAGIFLDTSYFKRNIGPDTFRIVQKLVDSGANPTRVTELFSENLESIKKVNGLIEKTQMISCMIALIAASEDEEYSVVEIAKAADKALELGADAAFAIGRLDNGEISISGRSKNNVNIGSIMGEMGGGGNPSSGAAKVKDSNIETVENQLKMVLKPSYYSFNKNNETK